MKNTDRFYYLVEGACEKKIIETFKEQKNLIVSGKVIVFNAVQDRISPVFLRTIQDNTICILVFDTDTANVDILEENIHKLQDNRKKVWLVLQVNNLEDELVRCTDVSEVKYLTGSTTNSEFKHDLINEKRLFDKLMKHHFDFTKIWITRPDGVFRHFINEGQKIKRNTK